MAALSNDDFPDGSVKETIWWVRLGVIHTVTHILKILKQAVQKHIKSLDRCEEMTPEGKLPFNSPLTTLGLGSYAVTNKWIEAQHRYDPKGLNT